MPEIFLDADKYIGRMPQASEVKKYFQRNGNSAGEFIWYIEDYQSPYTLSVTIELNENDTLSGVFLSKLKTLSDMGRCRFESVELTSHEIKYICGVLDACFPDDLHEEGEKLYGAPKIARKIGCVYAPFELDGSEFDDSDIEDAQTYFCEYAESVENGNYSFAPGDMIFSASVLQSQQNVCLELIKTFARLMHKYEDDLKKWVHFAFACSLLTKDDEFPIEISDEIEYISKFVFHNYESVLMASYRGADIFYLDTITYRFGIETVN